MVNGFGFGESLFSSVAGLMDLSCAIMALDGFSFPRVWGNGAGFNGFEAPGGLRQPRILLQSSKCSKGGCFDEQSDRKLLEKGRV